MPDLFGNQLVSDLSVEEINNLLSTASAEQQGDSMPEIIFPSEFLKIGINTQQNDIIKFKDSGVLDDETERYIFQVEIYRGGVFQDTKKLTLNKTNFKAVSAAYGTNSDAWVGKEMEVNSVKTRNPQTGLLIDGVVLTAPLPSAAPSVATPAAPTA